MTDYKQMYLELIRGTERAINTLIDAQRRCEELYISAPEAEITILPSKEAKTDKQQYEAGAAQRRAGLPLKRLLNGRDFP